MKITEIESKIEQGDCSEEMLDLFKAALKRVPKSNRCQHCYTTAAAMPLHFHSQAIALIRYGLSEHCNHWFDYKRSYDNLAMILELTGDYMGAKQAYVEARSAIDPGCRSDYESEYAANFMRTEMHISGFEYTADLENYYSIAVQADEFSQAFQKRKFYRLLAEIIIFVRNKDFNRAYEAFAAANEMLKPGSEGPLTQLLKRKGFIESTGATKEALAFLKRAKKYFE